MSLHTIRHGVLPLILTCFVASPVSANWLSEWFTAASHEELPAPEPESAMPVPVPEPGQVPTLVPPHQSHRWADPQEVPFPESDQMELPPLIESEDGAGVWSDVWGDGAGGEVGSARTVLDPPGLSPEFDSLECCSQPTIRYWNHPLIGLATTWAEPCEKQHVVLVVDDPCCAVEVPVRIPAQCMGTPECDTTHGLFGRTTYDYRWPDGTRVKIVRWGQGDLMVHTYNPPEISPLSCVTAVPSGRLFEL